VTAIIKRGDRHQLTRVRPLGGARPQPPPTAPAETAPSPEQQAIHRLEKALRTAEEQLATARREQAAALEKARSDAHTEGLAAGRRRSDDMLAALAKAADETRVQASEMLGRSETLALAIARTALGRLLGDRAQWGDMVATCIAERRAHLDAALLLRIRVSAGDFGGTGAQNVLAGVTNGVETIIDEGLPAGRCLFELRLGDIEIGPATQAERLLAFLDDKLGRSPS